MKDLNRILLGSVSALIFMSELVVSVLIQAHTNEEIVVEYIPKYEHTRSGEANTGKVY